MLIPSLYISACSYNFRINYGFENTVLIETCIFRSEIHLTECMLISESEVAKTCFTGSKFTFACNNCRFNLS